VNRFDEHAGGRPFACAEATYAPLRRLREKIIVNPKDVGNALGDRLEFPRLFVPESE
jgi:hypothetical protein